jgi:hypothetical protein
MRDTIDAIRELTTAIETKLASLQIYQDREAIQRGSPMLKELAEKTTLLEGTFSICAHQYRQDDAMHEICANDPQSVRDCGQALRHPATGLPLSERSLG